MDASDEQDNPFKHNQQVQHETLDRLNPSAGDPNTTKFELVQNQHRDTAALFIAHASMLDTIAMSQNVSRRRAQYQMMQSMALPVGLDPNKQ